MSKLLPSSFLSVDNGNEMCLLCYRELLKSEKYNCLSEKGWESFQANAKTWFNIDIPSEDPLHNFWTGL